MSAKDAADMKAFRDAMYWTQDIAAKALGIGIPMVSAVENNRAGLTRQARILMRFYLEKAREGQSNMPVPPWERSDT